ncbi:hypothetical protein CALCODRAFT_64944 [Calocera cornea HHB12733]|uniref:Uncharacterized protein n=1 Tax=Calocera cornea HHB12733 TaxID=1353952 RepID=A0A165DL10_9BASI|nr:hypothetical protein CALCODRAFT_64944 [Calocera cornea HHB12733]
MSWHCSDSGVVGRRSTGVVARGTCDESKTDDRTGMPLGLDEVNMGPGPSPSRVELDDRSSNLAMRVQSGNLRWMDEGKGKDCNEQRAGHRSGEAASGRAVGRWACADSPPRRLQLNGPFSLLRGRERVQMSAAFPLLLPGEGLHHACLFSSLPLFPPTVQSAHGRAQPQVRRTADSPIWPRPLPVSVRSSMNHPPLPSFGSSQADYTLPPLQLHQHNPSSRSSSTLRPVQPPAPHHHHHHHIIHRHPGVEQGPVEIMSGPPPYMQEPERPESYFTRVYPSFEGVEVIGETRASTGGDNWGRKLHNVDRNMRKRRLGTAGVYATDFQAEERARKRVKLLLPTRSPSPPALQPPGFKEFHSPPASPHLPPTNLDPAPSLSSFLAAPGTRHSFDPMMLNNLSKMTRDLIKSEGEGNRSLGRLFFVLSEKASINVPQFPNGVSAPRNGRSPSMVLDGGPALPQAYHDLFVTPGGITLPDRRDLGEAETYFPSAAHQVVAVNQWLTQIRGVYDDLREYLHQLDQVHVGIAKAQLGRKRVWAAVRTEVAKELEIPLPKDSGEQGTTAEAETA